MRLKIKINIAVVCLVFCVVKHTVLKHDMALQVKGLDGSSPKFTYTQEPYASPIAPSSWGRVILWPLVDCCIVGKVTSRWTSAMLGFPAK